MLIQLMQKLSRAVRAFLLGITIFCAGHPVLLAQSANGLTPIQQRIEKQRQRLSSSEPEERRDALMKLAAMRHIAASRAALPALSDADPIVRVTAVHAIEALPPADASAALTPLLGDKQELVRREAAHALGATRSPAAVQPLIELLNTDKEAAVRAAAAMALGQVGNEAAVVPLANVLSGGGANKKKSKTGTNEFVMSAAARSLGKIHSRAGVPVLIETLNNDANPIEVRRAAAEALGAIGDPTATPALTTASESSDPYLSQTARASIRRLH
ncbi:MAG TPA: HEAT repeat domain-containing protein [Pyrinomonadaceae bacterium]|nr:HEAT repeat domain-containing protein [Pyrinomonadaceae bacterium]